MGQIIVRLEKFAVESTVQEILTAAAAAAGTTANAAEVVRDASGRVVQVNVNLPQSTAPGLATAAAKINANIGVAQVAATTRVEDYASALDALVPGTDVTSITNGLITMTLPGGSGVFKAALAADSVGGVGSALITSSYQEDGPFKNFGRQIAIQASEFGLSAVKEYEIEFKLRKKGVWPSSQSAYIVLNSNVNMGVPHRPRLLITSSGMDAGFDYETPTFSSALTDAYQTIKLGYKGGRIYVAVNGIMREQDISAFGEFPSSRIDMSIELSVYGTPADLLIDDVKVTLFSGVI